MMYASKTPVRRRLECRGCIDSNGGRDWYDEHQRNEPNPILIAYRRGHIAADQVVHMGSSLIGAWVDERQILRPHMDHARRVLSRLANLKEES